MAADGVQLTATTSARASKTWVLPPRAKPGRKSKKDLAATASEPVDDEEQEKTASRTKQKASRERKQEYIVELEAKVRTYEQGDGERASFFQELAKRYSEERDTLRQENEDLRRRLSVYEPSGSASPTVPIVTRKASNDLLSTRAKRSRNRSGSVASASSTSSVMPSFQAIPIPSASAGGSAPLQHQKSTSGHGPYRTESNVLSISSSYVPPSPPVSSDQSYGCASTSESSQAGGCGLCDKTASTQCICDEIGLNSEIHNLTASTSAISSEIASVSCGMCDETASTECICRQMGIDPAEVSAAQSSPHTADCGFCDETASTTCICRDMGIRTPRGTEISRIALPTLVPNTLAVPLRGSKNRTASSGPVWRIDNLQPVNQVLAGPAAASVALRRNLIKVGSRLPCSGDPRTCPACADDPAGQAFCSALSSTVCSTNPCATCPNRPSPLSQQVSIGGAVPSTIASGDEVARQSLRRRDSSTRDEVPEAMIPCSDAWATLRAHPNIGFANLDLLANVVAKRTYCLGEMQDSDGKVMEVGREGVEEALELLDHVRE